MQDYKEIASQIADDFGANATYVEDLLRQFQHNPKSVDEEWGEYFDSLLGGDGSVKVESRRGPLTEQATTAQPAAAAPAIAPRPSPPVAETTTGERIQIRGSALKIVENMESSLAVPTATSARQIQIKVLDENRRWVNRHLEAQGGGKTSYTHFIAWAMIKALEKYPQMNDGYEEVDGAAYRVRPQNVNLGVAVDVQKKDGSRSLLVPNIKGSNRMSFKQFVDAYQDTVKRARDGKSQVSDFQGTTISLTNPGTIGT
ncbi:MAG TPA: 2-oxo acid dehydrogenase subunit E2, partial [Blastocatellia bacterium]|nr:2-oxo acid dehydrogenase subunit E2 [Blastocatellia bacterium]